MLGKNVNEVFHLIDENPEGNPLKALIVSGGTVATGEMEMVAGGGTFLVTVAPIFNDEVKLSRVFFVAKDITERKQAEEALRESEEKHRALIETTNTGYHILDTKGRIIDANKEYIRFTGYNTPEEIVGRNVLEWTASCDMERSNAELKKCIEQGLPEILKSTTSAGLEKPLPLRSTRPSPAAAAPPGSLVFAGISATASTWRKS